MQKLNIAAVMSVALLAVSASAHAASNASSAGITQLSYQLIDLDLNDGITPSLTFTSFNNRQSVSVGYGGQYEYTESETFGDLTITHAAGNARSGLSSTSASASGALAPSPSEKTSLYARAGTVQLFTLSANTGLTWSALGSLSTDHAAGGAGSARIYLHGTLDDAADDVWEYGSFSDGANATFGNGVFQLTGYLASRGAATGYVSTGVEISNSSLAELPAVPEPESYAMLAAGLVVLGAARRRKSAQS